MIIFWNVGHDLSKVTSIATSNNMAIQPALRENGNY
jgi:hypothetical protein